MENIYILFMLFSAILKTGRKLTPEEKSICLSVIAKICRRQLDECGHEQYHCIRDCLGYVIGDPAGFGAHRIGVGENTPVWPNTKVVVKMLESQIHNMKDNECHKIPLDYPPHLLNLPRML